MTTLEKTIGMSLAALTPRGTEFSWQLAGLAVCAAEYAIASAVGVDPIRTLIPITALAFVVDRRAAIVPITPIIFAAPAVARRVRRPPSKRVRAKRVCTTAAEHARSPPHTHVPNPSLPHPAALDACSLGCGVLGRSCSFSARTQ